MERKGELEKLMEENGINFDSMELWHIFSRVFRNGRKTIENELEKLGIKPMELRVLFSLSRKGPSNMNLLSSENDVTSPWITGIADDLEKNGYITKDRSSRDRRVVNVSITKRGEEMLLRGVRIYTQLIEMALSHLQPEEIEQFREILQKIEDALKEQV